MPGQLLLLILTANNSNFRDFESDLSLLSVSVIRWKTSDQLL